MSAGANPIYLGPEVPIEELLRAVERSRAAALALSFVAAPRKEVGRSLAALRGGLPPDVHLWIGGASSRVLATPPGVERLDELEQLEQRVGLLDFERRKR